MSLLSPLYISSYVFISIHIDAVICLFSVIRVFSCVTFIFQVFGAKADLQLHTQIHMREAKPYKCSQCTKSFANSSYLSQHTRIHLGVKPYRCDICQRKFTQLSHLQQHIRTHTGDKPYACRHPGCAKSFSQLSSLQSHSRCHQGDKPFKCNSCYKCFNDEVSLLEHIPRHKESKHLKTHICTYCGKSYTQETYLAKHMQRHTEGKPTGRRSNVNGGVQQSTTPVSGGTMGSSMSQVPFGSSRDALYWSPLPTKQESPQTPPACMPDSMQHHLTSVLGEDLSRTGLVPMMSSHPSYDMKPVSTSPTTVPGSSAFAPLTSQLPPRSYFSYEPPISSFNKHHQTMSTSTERSPTSPAFQNQLFSLHHQIRNYQGAGALGPVSPHAHPFSAEHTISLKERM